MIIEHCSLISRISRHGIGLLAPGARRTADAPRFPTPARPWNPRPRQHAVALALGECVAVDGLSVGFVRVPAAAACGEHQADHHSQHESHILAPYLCGPDNFAFVPYTCNISTGAVEMRQRVFLLLVLGTACRPVADRLTHGTWVDLTYAFDSTTIYWPTAAPFRLTVVSAQRTPAGYYYAANNFAAAEHGGTHLDAPVHFVEGRHTTDQIPIEQLMGPAGVVDVFPQTPSTSRHHRPPAALAHLWAVPAAIPPAATPLPTTAG